APHEHHQAKLDATGRIGVTDLSAKRHEERQEFLDQIPIDVHRAGLEHGVRAGAKEERPHQTPSRAVDLDRLFRERLEYVARGCAAPAGRIEDVVSTPLEFGEEPFVE